MKEGGGEHKDGKGTRDNSERWTRPTLGTSRNNPEAVLLAHTNMNLRTVKTPVNMYVNQKCFLYILIFLRVFLKYPEGCLQKKYYCKPLLYSL